MFYFINFLSIFRIIAPIFIVYFFISAPLGNGISLIPVTIFIIASISDWLDGFCARKFNLVSNGGALLDTIADKVLIVVILILLIEQNLLPAWAKIGATIIILREVTMPAIREFLRSIGKSADVAMVGKIKATVQMIAIIFLLIIPYGNYYWQDSTFYNKYFISFAFILFFIAIVLTIYSLIIYVFAGFKKD